MPKQEKLDEMYMAIASEVNTLSYCKRKKVGCIIVDNNNILSMGYNGTPSGFNNECEWASHFLLFLLSAFYCRYKHRNLVQFVVKFATQFFIVIIVTMTASHKKH